MGLKEGKNYKAKERGLKDFNVIQGRLAELKFMCFVFPLSNLPSYFFINH